VAVAVGTGNTSFTLVVDTGGKDVTKIQGVGVVSVRVEVTGSHELSRNAIRRTIAIGMDPDFPNITGMFIPLELRINTGRLYRLEGGTVGRLTNPLMIFAITDEVSAAKDLFSIESEYSGFL
jgi:hypothetical protein